MADEYFVGLRATEDVTTNEYPEFWRAGIARLFPNGMAPLTGLTALMRSEKVDSPHFHWWTKTLTTQRATLAGSGLYNDSLLAGAYTGSSGVAGDMIFASVSLADSKMFRAGHQVLLRDANDYNVDTTAKVLSVTANGATSVIACKALEADDNSTTATTWADVDTILIVGNINPMGGTRPTAIAQSPTELENNTQIWRNSLDLSRTLMHTKLRTVDAYTETKRDSLEQHSIEIEKSLFWSTIYATSGTAVGTNDKPEFATRGLISWIRSYGTVEDFSLDTGADYEGKTWLQAGEQWLDEHFEEMFRYGSGERLAFCGSGALQGIQRLAKDVGWTPLTPKTTSWGSNVLEWVTPFGQITLKTHPLFSLEPTNRFSMVLIEPRNLIWRYIDDTDFYPDTTYMKGGGTGVDGKQEEFLTEAGLEVRFPEAWGYLNGIGKDNA